MLCRGINKRLFLITAATAVSSLLTSRTHRSSYLPHAQLALCSSASSTPSSSNLGTASLHRFLADTTFPFHDDILPIRPIREVFDEKLSTWVSRSTQDFQLLTFTPKNLTVQLALLRLLGFTDVSLDDFGRTKGGDKCFLTTLPLPTTSSGPQLIVSSEDVLSTIREFNTTKPTLPSYDPTISNAVDHVKPFIEKNAENDICSDTLSAFYQKIGNASERELHAFCDAVLGQAHQHYHQRMFTQLQAAQPLCRAHPTKVDTESCRHAASR